MKLQAHITGQAPNQTGSQLPALTQLNGNALPPQMSNVGGFPRSTIDMDPEFLKARDFVQEKM